MLLCFMVSKRSHGCLTVSIKVIGTTTSFVLLMSLVPNTKYLFLDWFFYLSTFRHINTQTSGIKSNSNKKFHSFATVYVDGSCRYGVIRSTTYVIFTRRTLACHCFAMLYYIHGPSGIDDLLGSLITVAMILISYEL